MGTPSNNIHPDVVFQADTPRAIEAIHGVVFVCTYDNPSKEVNLIMHDQVRKRNVN